MCTACHIVTNNTARHGHTQHAKCYRFVRNSSCQPENISHQIEEVFHSNYSIKVFVVVVIVSLFGIIWSYSCWNRNLVVVGTAILVMLGSRWPSIHHCPPIVTRTHNAYCRTLNKCQTHHRRIPCRIQTQNNRQQ